MAKIFNNADNLRVLLVKLSSFGDVVQSLPVANALRRALPNSEISWLIDSSLSDLVRLCDSVDKVHELELRAGFFPQPKCGWRNFRKVHYDLVIDLQGLFRSAVFSKLAKSKCLLGFSKGMAREGSWYFYDERVTPCANHICERYLEMLGFLEISSPKIEFNLKSVESSLDLPTCPYVFLAHDARWASKRWPVQDFARLVRTLHEKYGLLCVMHSLGESEVLRAQRIAKESEVPVVLKQGLTIFQLSSLIRGARLCVGGDTGPLHFAAALGTPVVGLFGLTSAQYFMQKGASVQTVQSKYSGEVPWKKRRNFMKAIESLCYEDVFHVCRESLRGLEGQRGVNA